MHAAHDADGIQQYIPGGVPGMTAGGEPPRWNGDEPHAVVASSPRTDSAGRGDVQTRGGGTVEGPYGDFSDRDARSRPEDARRRLHGPVSAPWGLLRGGRGRSRGTWAGTGRRAVTGPLRLPGGPVAGGTDRGRAPNAFGKVSGYSLNPRSGMISLDLPDGTIAPVPGGVSDHHITVAYLGPDVDDDAFASACLRAAPLRP